MTPGPDPIADSPFCQELGMKVLEWGEGSAVVALDVGARLQNRRAVAHGGVVASLADMALSLAWRSAAPDRTAAGTINLNVNFIAPAVGTLTAEGRLMRLTGGCAFCDAQIRDAEGALVATAQGAFRARKA